MINYEDNRNFYRMMLNSEAKVTIIDDEANSVVLATCRDLSAEGIAIEMLHPLEISTNVRVNIESANNNIPTLDVKGKVVRVTEEGLDCFLVGINITEMD